MLFLFGSMLSHLRPAEHLFALALNLFVIVIATVSLARLLPQSLTLDAKLQVLKQQVAHNQALLEQLNQNIELERSQPHLNPKLNANLIQNDQISIFWAKEETKTESKIK